MLKVENNYSPNIANRARVDSTGVRGMQAEGTVLGKEVAATATEVEEGTEMTRKERDLKRPRRLLRRLHLLQHPRTR